MNEKLIETVNAAKSNMLHAKALLGNAYSDLSEYDAVTIDPSDPYSCDFHHVRSLIMHSSRNLDDALFHIRRFKEPKQ